MENQLLRHPSLNEIAYDFIKERIITGAFAPGFRLKEELLVKMLGISKTPIKLGIAKLEQEGLVDIIPRRGSYVIALTREDIKEIFLLREVLEGLAARLAIQHLSNDDIDRLKQIQSDINGDADVSDIQQHIRFDDRFHGTIIQAAGHRLLTESLNPILNKIEIVKYRTAVSVDRRAETVREHSAIIKALEDRDENAAESAMRRHLQNAMKAAIRNFEFFSSRADLD